MKELEYHPNDDLDDPASMEGSYRLIAPTPEQKVKEKWSSARAKNDWPGKWTIRVYPAYKPSGEGATEAEAWADAAARIARDK